MILPVSYRGDPIEFPEGLCEIRLGGKSCRAGDIRDGEIRIPEKLTGSLQSAPVQILDRRKSGIFGKGMCHIIFIHVSQPCQGVQSNMFCIVCVQIFFYLGTFFCHPYSIDGDRHQLAGRAEDPQDQYFKKVLTDQFRTVAS